jgi:general secretion pathway protein M
MIDRIIKALPFKSLIGSFALQRREKIVVGIGAMALTFFLLLQVAVFPILDRRTRLAAQIGSAQKAMLRMGELKTEYVKLTQTSTLNETQLKQRPKEFTLFSFLEGLAGQGNIKQNIVYMKPSTTNVKGSTYVLSIVEMKIDAITMEQLVAFVHGIETAGRMAWIKRLSIDKGDKQDSLLNAVLHVETLTL